MARKLLLVFALLLVSLDAGAQTKIKTTGITDGAVTTDKIADNAVTTGKVALDTLTASDLAPDAVGASEIAANAVGTAEIADGTVAAGDLAATLDLSSKTLTLPAGATKIRQVVNTQTGAVATGSTTIPFDDTIPQNTEGDQYMTLSITPTSATSKLRIDVVFNCAASALAQVVVALFQDSTANALAAITASRIEAAGVQTTTTLTHYMTAGTTSATTFKVRAGPSSGTLTFNGSGGVRRFGGVTVSSMTITEIAP